MTSEPLKRTKLRTAGQVNLARALRKSLPSADLMFPLASESPDEQRPAHSALQDTMQALQHEARYAARRSPGYGHTSDYALQRTVRALRALTSPLLQAMKLARHAEKFGRKVGRM